MKQNTQATGQVKNLRTVIGLGASACLLMMTTIPAGAVPPITNSFAFGPGTTLDHSCERTFYIPAGSILNFIVSPSKNNVSNIPLAIEVHRADTNSINSTGPDGPLQDLVSPTFLTSSVILPPQPVNGGASYGAEFGCPSTWRVRVRTQNNTRPVF